MASERETLKISDALVAIKHRYGTDHTENVDVRYTWRTTEDVYMSFPDLGPRLGFGPWFDPQRSETYHSPEGIRWLRCPSDLNYIDWDADFVEVISTSQVIGHTKDCEFGSGWRMQNDTGLGLLTSKTRPDGPIARRLWDTIDGFMDICECDCAY